MVVGYFFLFFSEICRREVSGDVDLIDTEHCIDLGKSIRRCPSGWTQETFLNRRVNSNLHHHHFFVFIAQNQTDKTMMRFRLQYLLLYAYRTHMPLPPTNICALNTKSQSVLHLEKIEKIIPLFLYYYFIGRSFIV